MKCASNLAMLNTRGLPDDLLARTIAMADEHLDTSVRIWLDFHPALRAIWTYDHISDILPEEAER